jgi:hypothetical protein
MPRDPEVDEADAKRAERTRRFKAATAWRHPRHPAPLWIKLNLVMAAGLTIVACYAAQFFSECVAERARRHRGPLHARRALRTRTQPDSHAAPNAHPPHPPHSPHACHLTPAACASRPSR